MAQLKFRHQMSLRAKLIDDNTAEVVIIDHDSFEEFGYIIPFRVPKSKVVKIDTPVVESDEKEVIPSDVVELEETETKEE